MLTYYIYVNIRDSVLTHINICQQTLTKCNDISAQGRDRDSDRDRDRDRGSLTSLRTVHMLTYYIYVNIRDSVLTHINICQQTLTKCNDISAQGPQQVRSLISGVGPEQLAQQGFLLVRTHFYYKPARR